MTSLRTMATIWLAGLLVVVGIAAVVISYRFAEAEANEFLDLMLQQIALNVGMSIADVAALPPHETEDEIIIEIWSPNGDRIQTSHPQIAIPLQSGSGFASFHAAGNDWRTYVLMEPTRIVQVSQRMRVRLEIAEHAAIHAAAPLAAVIALSWLTIGWWLNHALNRLSALAEGLAREGRKGQKLLPVDQIPNEFRPFITAINALVAQLQAALDRQRQFLADAAHQLRTPLAALRLQIENLKNEGTGAATAQLVDLDQGARRASVLVDQLLRMTRYDTTNDQPQKKSIELSQLVKDCVADQVILAENKSIDMGITLAETGTICGSPEELQALFANLLDNAIRFTPSGGRIDVGIRRLNNGMMVEIADTGCGIPEEFLPRVFERFARGPSSEVEGTGLGLAIAKAIADRHGISVSLANCQDRSGVIAYVTFPGPRQRDDRGARSAFAGGTF